MLNLSLQSNNNWINCNLTITINTYIFICICQLCPCHCTGCQMHTGKQANNFKAKNIFRGSYLIRICPHNPLFAHMFEISLSPVLPHPAPPSPQDFGPSITPNLQISNWQPEHFHSFHPFVCFSKHAFQLRFPKSTNSTFPSQ